MKSLRFLYTATIAIMFFASCSPDSTGVVSKAYHNTTARYNAIYYSRERLAEIKTLVNNANEDDYENILLVLPKFDTTLANTYKDKTEDCIKKSSLAITLHKNSNWVDDAYILLGQARFYDRDFVNAIETFKYVNSTSEDDNARHLALIHLMNTFTDYGELNNGEAVVTVLKKELEDMSKSNKKLFYQAMGHLYQQANDHNKMVINLLEGAPLLKKKEGRSRVYFIIGQIYQELNFESEAYNYYRRVLKNKPTYELEFHTKLRMAQVTKLSDKSDLKTARKHFRSLLKDKKNEEYKGLIYFELAEFERRLGNFDEALDYYESSVSNSLENQRQKGKSYLKMGEIYFESLKRYPFAQSYYDSAVSVLPADFENIEAIKERKEVLDRLVLNLDIITLQDSLLQLATMDSTALLNKIRGEIEAEQSKKEAEEKLARKKQKRSSGGSAGYTSPFDTFGDNQGGGGSGWYFGNPASVSIGRDEFLKKWGQRPLEDNWRRSLKTANQSSNPDGVPLDNTNLPSDATANSPKEAFDVEAEVEARMQQLPFTEAEQRIAHEQLESAYYNLGKIYSFDLADTTNSINSFNKLIEDYSETEHKPETLYLLYLLYKGIDDAENVTRIRTMLLAEFPNSTYAKLVINPKYNEPSNEDVEALKAIYTKAYKMYELEQYSDANYKLDSGINQFQESAYTPWLKLLKVLIVGRTQDISKYKLELSKFIEQHPDHEISPYAVKLLSTADEFEKSEKRKKGVSFVKYFEQEHYFVITFYTESGLNDKINEELKHFNETDFANLELGTGSLQLSDLHSLILVNGLGGLEAASNYAKKIQRSNIMFKDIDTSQYKTFIITKDNFQIFYDNAALEEYLKFYQENYK